MPKEARINEQIRASEIRVIGAEGQQLGILPAKEGLRLAREKGLDLVEVAPTAKPPVCRIMNYGKYKYDQTKKEKDARKKQRVVEIKEIKIRPKIEEHDYQVKLQSAHRFLGHGDKVKVTLGFRGREMAHIDFGRRVFDRLIKDLEGVGQIEKPPHQEGRNLITVIAPK